MLEIRKGLSQNSGDSSKEMEQLVIDYLKQLLDSGFPHVPKTTGAGAKWRTGNN